MVMETIKDLKEVNGKKVMTNDERPKDHQGNVDWDAFDEMRNEYPICIDHESDMISCKMLTKPASEGGNLNLCQLTELISIAKHMLEYLNDKFPCEENTHTLFHLKEALMRQEERTKNRIKRNVEGKYEL